MRQAWALEVDGLARVYAKCYARCHAHIVAEADRLPENIRPPMPTPEVLHSAAASCFIAFTRGGLAVTVQEAEPEPPAEAGDPYGYGSGKYQGD
jgi:hypothetical protein